MPCGNSDYLIIRQLNRRLKDEKNFKVENKRIKHFKDNLYIFFYPDKDRNIYNKTENECYALFENNNGKIKIIEVKNVLD